MKTYTVKQLIQELKKYEKQNPNMPVYLSRDEEGNGFGTIFGGTNGYTSFGYATEKDMGHSDDDTKQMLILYPFEEGLDYSELEGGSNGK